MCLWPNVNLANQLNMALSKFLKMCYRYRSHWKEQSLPTEQAARDLFIKENPEFFALLLACDESEGSRRAQTINDRIDAAEREKLRLQNVERLKQETNDARVDAIRKEQAVENHKLQLMTRDAQMAKMEFAQKQEALRVASAEQPAPTGSNSAPMEKGGVLTDKDAIPAQETGVPLFEPPAMSAQVEQEVLDRIISESI